MSKITSILFLFISVFSYSQNSNCIGAISNCADGIPFPITSNSAIADPGNSYGCLGVQSNPQWYYMEVSLSGDIYLELNSTIDLDYVIWGPFIDVTTALNACGNLGYAPNPIGNVDCGYIGGNVEYPTINGAITGEIYIMMIANFTGVSTSATLTQVPGATGSLVCITSSYNGSQLMSGSAYYDINQNGLKDSLELPIPNAEINISPLTNQYFTNGNGKFLMATPASSLVNYDATATFAGWTGTNTPLNQTFALDTIDYYKDSLDFGFYPDSVFYNADLNLIDIPSHCITNNPGWINIINNGTLPINGLAQINLDSNVTYINSSITPDSIVDQTIYFSFDSLGLFQTLSIYYTTNLDTSLTLGDTVTNSTIFSIYDLSGNLQTTQFDTSVTQVVCSYDPNDKTAYINGNSTQETITTSDYIDYSIRFQNTGNAAAIDVEILDTIDINFDINTFQFLSASHLTDVSIDANRKVSFMFNDINLPDSISDEPGSHGYVSFRIYQNANLDPNTVLNNTAYIYFDNNLPITTNTVSNIIECYILPDTNITITNNQLSVLNSASNTYQWFLDGTLLPLEINADIQITGEGLYSVDVTNSFGCQSTSSYIYECIAANTTIDVVDHTLSVINSTDYSYQWYFEGILMPSETSAQLEFTNEGNYSIIITDEFGCESEASYLVDFTALKENERTSISIYPNPTKELINIKLQDQNTKIATLVIKDLSGKTVFENININSDKSSINISNLSDGIYFIEVTTDSDKKLTKKLVKI